MWRLYRAGMDLAQGLANLFLCGLHIEAGLQVHPELWGLPEIPAKPESDISGYRTGAVYNMTYPHGRHTNIMGKFGLRYARLIYNLLKYNTRMHRLKITLHKISPYSMIIGYFDLMRSVFIKPKADPPLIIDANTPLPLSLAGKCLKPVRRRKPEVVNADSGVKLRQTNNRSFLNIVRQLAGLESPEQPLSFLACERAYHNKYCKQFVYLCQDTLIQ